MAYSEFFFKQYAQYSRSAAEVQSAARKIAPLFENKSSAVKTVDDSLLRGLLENSAEVILILSALIMQAPIYK